MYTELGTAMKTGLALLAMSFVIILFISSNTTCGYGPEEIYKETSEEANE